jgi:GNAT superfamily N-acetyltransferase
MSLAVHQVHRRKGIASALLEYLAEYLKPDISDIKIFNIPDQDLASNKFLIDSGCKKLTGQFEMEYVLK